MEILSSMCQVFEAPRRFCLFRRRSSERVPHPVFRKLAKLDRIFSSLIQSYPVHSTVSRMATNVFVRVPFFSFQADVMLVLSSRLRGAARRRAQLLSFIV